MVDILFGLYQSLSSGLTYGLIISLLAAGLALIYGVMGTINISHGTFYMLGGFLALFASNSLLAPSAVSVIFSTVAAFFIGMGALFLIVPSKLRVTTDPDLQSVAMILLLALATVGQQLVYLYFGSGFINTPSLIRGSFALPFGVYVNNQILLSVILTLGVYISLHFFLRKTRLGQGIRAFSQDREIAESLGVNGDRISLVVFGIGVSTAALAGALLSSVYSINSSTGWNELITAFIIVTFGGIGSVMGSLIGGLIYGIIYSVVQYFYPPLSFVIVLLFIYIIMIAKPTGLLGEIVERA